jgi:hypothetical protein
LLQSQFLRLRVAVYFLPTPVIPVVVFVLVTLLEAKFEECI